MGKRAKQWRTLAAVSCAAASACHVQTIVGAAHASSPMKRILVLGDSLSEGFGLRPDQAYPSLLIDKLRSAGLSFELTNASQSGGTTEEGLQRLPRHLKPMVDIFILELA